MINSVLFVCLGNICRSPTAEAIFRKKAHLHGLSVVADSAGTAGWHVGKPPYGAMLSEAADFGYDLSSLRARQLEKIDFSKFDVILAMDQQNLKFLQTLAPKNQYARLSLMGSYISFDAPPDVPDPYYTRDFVATLELLQQAIDNFLMRHWPNICLEQ